MFRFAACSLFLSVTLAILGFSGVAGDFAGLALILFGVAALASGAFFGIGALNARDEKRCYN
jgi:uncharacterized membrane protein YtjA (UPF0391 family)